MTETRSSLFDGIKHLEKTRLSGFFFLLGGIEWFLGILAAESWYDGYSSRIDYVSDLGTGPTALIYNLSVFIFGVFVVTGSILLYYTHKGRIFPILMTISGIGIMGVGVFPANLQPMHSVATLLAILIGAIAAIASYTYQTKPMSIIAVALGLMSLSLAIVFFPYLGLTYGSTETFLGMAKGSLERWAINPILGWFIGFGGYLMGVSHNTVDTEA